MHGHLDLGPLLLAPGSRCTIGAAEHCTARLTHAALVEEEHCVIEVAGRKTMLTSWADEATWLNDRLVIEPRELVAGDRVAIGPFDFRLRFASAAELVEANLAPQESLPTIEESSPLSAGTGVSLGTDLKTDLITELSRRNPRGSVQSPPEQMTQHVSTLLGDLQNQVQLLQEKDAELNGQLRQRRENSEGFDSGSRSAIVRAVETTRHSASQMTRVAALSREAQWKKQAEETAAQLQADRETLERERAALISDQTRHEELLKQIEQQQSELAQAAETLTVDRQQHQSEVEQLRQRTLLLSEKEEQLTAWENRLLAIENPLHHSQTEPAWLPNNSAVPENSWTPHAVQLRTAEPRFTESRPMNVAKPNMADSVQKPRSIPPVLSPQTQRPLQTFLTLIAFTIAAVLLGIGIGDPDVSLTIGWSTAIMGAISTVDLLCRRWFGD
jgi:hypothetical protein